jgi:hypothetical protein
LNYIHRRRPGVSDALASVAREERNVRLGASSVKS